MAFTMISTQNKNNLIEAGSEGKGKAFWRRPLIGSVRAILCSLDVGMRRSQATSFLEAKPLTTGL
jgi:hypothetical protein